MPAVYPYQYGHMQNTYKYGLDKRTRLVHRMGVTDTLTNSKMKTTKHTLFNAFVNGLPCPVIGLKIVNAVEREDGSNKRYLVSGFDFKGAPVKQAYVQTED